MLRTFPDYAIIFLATWYYAIRNNLWSPRMQTHMTNCVVGRAVTKDNQSEPVRASARGSELNALQE